MQVHLPKADGVGVLITLIDRRHRADVAHVGDRRQRANSHFYRFAEVRRVHRRGDIQRAEVTGDIFPHLLIREVFAINRRRVDLQNLGTEVTHVDATLDWVRAVHRVFKHHVRVTGFKLDLCQNLEELTGVDFGFMDALVVNHFTVFLRDADFRHRHAVDLLHVIRREQVHIFIVLRQLEGDIRDNHAERQGLDADLLIGVFALGIQEPQDVRMVRVEIHRARALTRTELVGVGEGVFQHLHNRNDAGGLVLNAFNRRTDFTDVGQHKGHAAAAFRQLQRRVHRATNRLHIVFNAQQEAGDQLAALLFAAVQEGWRGRLEAARDDFIDEVAGEGDITLCQRQRHHAHAVFVTLKIAFAVEGFQRVAGVILESAQKGLEAEFFGISLFKQTLNVFEGVLIQHLRFVITFFHQITQLFRQIVEKHRVLIHVLQEVLARSEAVFVELDAAFGIEQIQHRVQRVIVRAAGVCLGKTHFCRCQNSVTPCVTFATSSGVPSNSKRYR